MSVRILSPATSANLGPGFDVLAIALDIQLIVDASLNDSGVVTIAVADDAPPELRDAEHNLVTRGYRHACRALGVQTAGKGAHFQCSGRVPVARGLGSSAAASVAGVLAASHLHDLGLDEGRVLELATELEGHGDNAAAALLGGLVVCVSDSAPLRVDVPEDLCAVLFVPDTMLPTAEARAILPASYSRADAVFNLGRCAALVHAIATRRYELLRAAMQDRWHQPYRTSLMPSLPSLISAALDGGAYGAALSGAGTSVLALTDPAVSQEVEAALSGAARIVGVTGDTLSCRLSNRGAITQTLP